MEPDLKLYCGDVNIEFRTGVLKYEALHRLQLDPRLPTGLNTLGNIRVILGSIEMMSLIALENELNSRQNAGKLVQNFKS